MAATRGNRNEVAHNFDGRMKAKAEGAANDGLSAAGEGPDMFEAAGGGGRVAKWICGFSRPIQQTSWLA